MAFRRSLWVPGVGGKGGKPQSVPAAPPVPEGSLHALCNAPEKLNLSPSPSLPLNFLLRSEPHH